MALAITNIARLMRAGFILARHGALLPAEQTAQLPALLRGGLKLCQVGTNASTNQSTGAGSTDYPGVPLLFGTGFTAELWAETAAGSGIFTPLVGTSAKVGFRTTATLGGFIQNGAASILVPSVPGPANGSSAFQVRAWDNGGTALVGTYADALMAGRAVGISSTFTSPVIAAPSTPGQVVGLTSFNLTIVPEPGVIALGVLGLGALLLRRRK